MGELVPARNGSVEYTHRDEGHTDSDPSTASSTKRDHSSSVAAAPPSPSVDLVRRSAASGIWPSNSNCTNRRPSHRRLMERTQPADPRQPIDTDDSIDRPAPYIPPGPVAFTDDDDDGHLHNQHRKPSSSAGERVNLQHGTDEAANEEAFEREGQISRTLSEILPVTLVVFGQLAGDGQDVPGSDKLLRVDPYVGLLRWDDRLEDALWQALGWSEWSDYTRCSVACGGGVQQRFRHCLQSASAADRSMPKTRFEPPAPPTLTPALPYAHYRWSTVFHGEIENPTTTQRTQPVTYGAPPGVSMPHFRESKGKGTVKRKLESKQIAAGERVQKMAFHGTEVNEKRIMNPATNEPISSESIPARWMGRIMGRKFDPPAYSGQIAEAPVEQTHHNRQHTDGADSGSTWPVCEGHNIEQRSCNAFDCTGTIDLLTALTPTYPWRPWTEAIDDRINYEINQLDQNFTLMMSLRLKPVNDVNEQSSSTSTVQPTGGHIFSIRSKLTAGSSLSINFETDGHGGLRVLQEKYGLSEMLPVRSGELTLHDGGWHSLALSGRYGGFVTVYIDCQWINSFVLTKGSIELPQYPTVEVGRNVELRQLAVVPGEKSARLQCNSQTVPIHDTENRRVTNYFEHLN
uniref:Laminin G domain-containing protein n=1 Tax=Anopheles epiroticus TaxID=199890 RepID=A0A182PDZ0_9DIPT